MFLSQIENIDACLGFLAAKGVNIKGLCAEGETSLKVSVQPKGKCSVMKICCNKSDLFVPLSLLVIAWI